MEDKDLTLVVITDERNVIEVVRCKDRAHAVAYANKALQECMEDMDRGEEFETGDGEHEDWEMATEHNGNAWCNYRTNWDAHIIAPGEIKDCPDD